MRYLLSHRTSYTYASSVDSAHHIAHLRARAFPGQKVSSISIATTPEPAMAVQHIDHFGNHIDIYRIDKPHQRFDIYIGSRPGQRDGKAVQGDRIGCRQELLDRPSATQPGQRTHGSVAHGGAGVLQQVGDPDDRLGQSRRSADPGRRRPGRRLGAG